ncbi:MAG TPA: glycogen synthase [Nitriliruptorales bacterium]
MRAALLTKEYPPEVYGGAGVHVEHLAAELAGLIDVEVHAFGAPRDSDLVAGTYQPWDALDGNAAHVAALRTVSVDLLMAAAVEGVDLVHSHTWYANLAGHLGKLLYEVPHVLTTHSLEPLRPWKREQLGGGYAVSSFCERTGIEHADAIIAVSEGMRGDILLAYPAVDPDRTRVVHNGVDPQRYAPDAGTDVLAAHGVDPDRPYAIFVGRITRQKGLTHLLAAAAQVDADVQLVLCAGAPDTDRLARQVREQVEDLRGGGREVAWIEQMLPRSQVIQLLTHATVLVCPSIYEPFGIVNLEAMACATAVVASDVGGIPEIVVDGVTGHLVSFEPDAADPMGAPADPECFARELASRINALVADPARAAAYGVAGRQRVLERFSWAAVAQRTVEVYRSVL